MSQIVDFHTHVLPGVDDGSQSVEESIALLREEAERGIGHLIATPHFYPRHDTPEHFLARRAEAEAKLRAEMSKHTGMPKLSIGAEVYFFYGISDCDAILPLTIDQKRCILVEMPFTPWTEKMYQELEGLYSKQGIMPIIAHVDRYLGRFRDYGIPDRLAELPVLVQANAEFFLNRATTARAMRMLEREQIHLLGSDCHNLSTRKPNLAEAVDKIKMRLGDTAVDAICQWQREALLN